MTDFFDDLEIEEENPFAPIGLDQAPTASAPKVPTAPAAPSMKDEKISSYKMFKNLKMMQSSEDNTKV